MVLRGVVLVGACLWAGVVRADPRYTLEWEAPSECPGIDAARASIDALLGDGGAETPVDASAAPVHARVRITAVGEGHHLALHVSDAAGVREIDAPTCTELAETATVIVAIAIDPGVLARTADPPEPTPEPESNPEPIPVPEPEPQISAPLGAVDRAPPPAPATRTPRPPVAIVSVLAGVDAGTLPRPSARLGVWAGPMWRDGTLELGGEYVVRRPVPSSSASNVGIRVQAWSIGARGCYSRLRRTVGFGLCGSVRAGAVHARGDGELTPRSARQPWVALGPGVGLLVAVRPRLALVFGLDALYTVARGGFRTEPSGTVARPWPVTFLGNFGVRWQSLTGRRRGGQPRR